MSGAAFTLSTLAAEIYGKPVAYTEVDVANYNDNATINAAYRIRDDGNYLVRVTGKGGFDNGTVTCWVVVSVSNGAINGIDKVVIDSFSRNRFVARAVNRNFFFTVDCL